MMSLPLVSTLDQPRSGRKRPDRKPKLPRKEALRLCREVLAAADSGGLRSAAKVLRKWAKIIPPAPLNVGLRGQEFRRPGYHDHLGRLAAALERGGVSSPVIVLDGNDKLAFAVFSELPLFTCPGMGACSEWCYSLHSWRCPGSLMRQLQNTLLMRHRPDLVSNAFRYLPAGITFRLYVDGDFSSVETVRFWMDLLWMRPDISAYGYSKSWVELLQYHEQAKGQWPPNYLVNVSSGARERNGVTADMVRALPCYRGDFIAVDAGYRPVGLKGNVGNERYADPEYHRTVRKAARKAGITGKLFSCPGKCHACTPHGHACGTERFRNITVVNGMH